MYGLIHKGIQNMVREKYGEATWQKIISNSDVRDDSFLAMQSYDDETTLKLVGAVSEVLGAPVDDCLRLFGKYWLAEFAPRDYKVLLDASGGGLFEFLENLDSLHDRITTTFVGYLPPSFRINRVGEDEAIVKYVSSRNGLLPFVIGLIEGMEQRFSVKIEILSVEKTVEEHGDTADIHIKVTT